MAEFAFWSSLLFVFYTYSGYPFVLIVLNRFMRSPVRKAPAEPDITLIMAAANEKDKIRLKILNCLALDYPREKLQIIVSLDGPTDGTEVLALGFASQGIQLTYTPKHKGKAAAINEAARQARGSVLVFVDARQVLDRNVLRELAANFNDPRVGAVSGELVLAGEENGDAGGVGFYSRYEEFIREMESGIHSVVGATSALYAIRAKYFQPLPEDTPLDDVVIPMNVVLHGGRVVLDREARAYDSVPKPDVEFRRRVRTLAGNFQLLMRMPELLNPWRNPVFFQFVSHKLMRLFVPYALVFLFTANLFLLRGGYLVFFGLQFLWYSLALAGCLASLAWSRTPAAPDAKPKVEGRT